MARAFACIVLAICLLASPASAAVIPRLAGMEAPTSTPFDLDQTVAQCEKSSATRDTTLAYAGSASLKVHTENDNPEKCKAIYARGIFETNSPYHLVEGDEFWFGAAIYLPKGFYAAHTGYTDLLRIDSYVNDKSESTPFEERAEINFASWENDDLYVRAAMGSKPTDLIGPISPSNLPEGTWNWVEIRVSLSTKEGPEHAWTKLMINGKSLGASYLPNLFAKAAPLNRLRYGIVSTAEGGSGNLTAYFDRASISHSERSPTLSSSENLVSRWRLDDAPSNVTATDTQGAASGEYINDPSLDKPGIVGMGLNTAVSFDGANDYVSITPTAPLNLKATLALEAWIKPDALQGSVIRRNNAYELRVQGDGSVLFRVWINGSVQSLTSAKGTASAGKIAYLVGTYDGAMMRLYVNGSQVASQSTSGTMTHGSDTLYLGRNDGAGTYFDGIIDEVSIYSEALSSEKILESYEAGKTREEVIPQLSNSSATTDLAGWSTPAVGNFIRSTAKPQQSTPANFSLEYYGERVNGTEYPVVTTTSNEVTATLYENEPYTFRFRWRYGGGVGLFSNSVGCITIYMIDNSHELYCVKLPWKQSWGDEWQPLGTSFSPPAEVEGYKVNVTYAPQGFLESWNGKVFFDDVEVAPG